MEASRLSPKYRLHWLRTLAFGIATAGCNQARDIPQDPASECSGCHGSAERPYATDGTEAMRLSNVLLRAAPPGDVAGNAVSTARGVGAHLAHVNSTATHGSIACATCHPGVTTAVVQDPVAIHYFTSSHINGNTTLGFEGIATAKGAAPVYDPISLTCAAAYCHGPSSPTLASSPPWNMPTTGLPCGGCHGDPPPPPHPSTTSGQCAGCHSNVVQGPNGLTFVDPNLHINGSVELQAQSCNGGCHGSATSIAPPQDLGHNTESTFRGVGAHQIHLNTTAGRKVQCNDCHLVPATVDAPTHIDTTAGAEVVFSVLVSGGAVAPVWDGQTCANAYCHNPSTAAQPNPGGAIPAPNWTLTGQATCGSCHALPPPAPHPTVSGTCSACHTNITDTFTFTNVDSHINGVVDF